MKLHRLDDHYSQAILTKIRSKETSRKEFRRGLRTLGMLTGIRIAATMGYSETNVETPLGLVARGISITEANSVIIVNVLRAATPLVEGLLEVFPDARIGVVNAKRVESGHLSPEYDFRIDVPYFNAPKLTSHDTLILADPMIASGSTSVAVLEMLLNTGQPKRIILVSVISAPLGLERVYAHFPDADVYTVAVDEGLNEQGYIVPGLGDAGDRVCG